MIEYSKSNTSNVIYDIVVFVIRYYYKMLYSAPSMGHLEQGWKEVPAMLELYATQLDYAASVLVSFVFRNLV